ncbi:energy transducer TonB [Alteromonas oceanisediminis]|uniref:energy transducer TonB n=1 Tax=Alteromonas oceanisediminis TaxID=2836180 RepID=UPI001BD94BEF|nr:energy transducer TonB [Alteromonas oceanisediminis]MBT0587882.1 energy transducer TonB [Alteromonas oceanisediminis]
MKAWILSLSLFAAGIHADDFSNAFSQYKQALENNDVRSALIHAKEAWVYGELKFGKRTENTLNLHFNYANMLAQNHLFDEAFQEYGLVEEGYRRSLGAYSEPVFNVRLERYHAGYQYSMINSEYKLFQAKRIGKKLMSHALELSEQYPARAADFHHRVISVFQKTSSAVYSHTRMIRFAKNAEALLIAKYGESDGQTIETRFYLAKLYRTDGQLKSAASKMEEVVHTLKSITAYTHPWQVKAHAQLVGIYQEMGNTDKADEHSVAIGAMTPWNEETIEPEPIYRVQADYPQSYAMVRKEGVVIVEFDISLTGEVVAPRVVSSTGGRRFEESTLDAIQQWRFAPKFVSGEAQIAHNRLLTMRFMIAH